MKLPISVKPSLAHNQHSLLIILKLKGKAEALEGSIPLL